MGTGDRFTFANRWLCDLLGYSPAELQGVHIGQTSHPDNRNAVNAERVHLWSGRMNSLQVQKRYLRKDGSTEWVKATVSVKRASSGKPEYEIAVFEDITAGKHADQLLRLEHGVTRCLAEADSESAAFQSVMGVLCENQGWPFAE